jgi:hypothetical protein
MNILGIDVSPLLLCLALFGLAVLVVVPIYLLRTRVMIVPEGQQIVVCQLGRFNRVAGPGPVVLNRSLDTVERTINVRDEPADYRVNGLFSYGLPFGYTLNFWRRTDLTAAAAGDAARLRQLALFEDDERRAHVATILRESLVHLLARLDQTYPLRAGAGPVDQLVPILPGIPRCDELLALLQEELRRRLPSVGVIVNMNQPIVIQAVHLGDDIVGSFRRGRQVALLREQWPGLTQEMLLQAFSAIEGLGQLPQSYFVLDTGAGAAAQVEVRTDGDAMQPRVKVRPGKTQPAAPPAQDSAPAVPGADPNRESLAVDDLGILKRVPPYSQERRIAS